MRHGRGALDLGAAILLAARIGDVVGDGVVEQMNILRHQRDLITQRTQRVFAQIVTVQQDFALLNVVKARQQAGQRRLA